VSTDKRLSDSFVIKETAAAQALLAFLCLDIVGCWAYLRPQAALRILCPSAEQSVQK
jgi:hypothetical protein